MKNEGGFRPPLPGPQPPTPDPFSIRRRFNRDVLWNVAGLAVLGASGITLNLIIGWYRGPAALGVFNQVYAIYIVLSQLAVGGIHASVLKHISHNQDNREKCSHIAATALLLASAISAIVCLAAYWQRSAAASLLQSPDVATGLAWAIPGLFFFSLNKVLLNVLNGIRNMRAFATFNALRFILIVAAVALLIARGAAAATLPLGFTVAEALLFVTLTVYVNSVLKRQNAKTPKRQNGEKSKSQKVKTTVAPASRRWSSPAESAIVNPQDTGETPVPQESPIVNRQSSIVNPQPFFWLREHLSFGFRGMLSGIISDLNTRVDVLMLGYFATDHQVGIYTMAATLAEGLYMLPVAVQRNVNPIIGRCFAQGDTARIQQIARKVRHIMYPAMALIALAAIAVYPLLLSLLFPSQDFAASWPVFAILLAGVVVHSGYAPMGGILFQGGRPGLHTMLMLCVVTANAGLNALLIPHLGIIGAAAATACAYALQAAGLIAFARRAFAVRL